MSTTKAQAASGRQLKGEDVGVPVRKMDQQYGNGIPDCWFMNNAFLSMFFAGFSANLPEGEAQFIHSVRAFQDRITDPVLHAQVRAFIGQEAHHSREHNALNESLKNRGYRLDHIEALAAKLNQWMRDYQSPEKQLAGTVAGEHITALLSDFFINKHPEYLREMAPVMEKIWAWHAIEETEHKAVAFDVYDQHVGDRNLLRRTMIEITIVFFSLNTAQAFALMRKSGQWTNWRMWRDAGRFARQMVRDLGRDYLDFYRKDYHPWQHDNRAALEWARRNYLDGTSAGSG
jgi:predicted metal-dependent hydrolase